MKNIGGLQHDTSVLKLVGLIFGGVLLFIGMAFLIVYNISGVNKTSKKCGFQTDRYGYCEITTTPDRYVDLSFYIDPEAKRPDRNDTFRLEKIEQGVATFRVMGQDFTCEERDSVPVGMGFVECTDIAEREISVFVYVGDPPR